MPIRNFVSTLPVLNVPDLAAVREWYVALLGEASVVPDEGVLEWEVAPGHWIQLAEEAEHPCNGSVIVETADLTQLHSSLLGEGFDIGDIVDYEVVKFAELADPAGNVLQFVEVVDND